MCGINGYIFKSKPDKENIISRMNASIRHRGPDDEGIHRDKVLNKYIGLGMTRLSIIDLSEKARQPFVSRDNNLIITYNGEIYNFKEIRNELKQNKILFKSNSDTEVILESYKYWGIEFVKKLRGMFAFAIWDNIKKELILARDPFGIKPLYYSKKNNILFFASQVKSILSIDNLSFENGVLSALL